MRQIRFLVCTSVHSLPLPPFLPVHMPGSLSCLYTVNLYTYFIRGRLPRSI